MHALGIWHEQMRPDRDKYVKIIENNIDPSKMHNFKKLNQINWKSLNKGIIYKFRLIIQYQNMSHIKNGILKCRINDLFLFNTVIFLKLIDKNMI